MRLVARTWAGVTHPLVILAATLAGIVVGGVAWLGGGHAAADAVWSVTTLLALIPLALDVGRDLAHRELGVDVIALLAMAGALLLGEALAGAVVAVMLSGGLTLESYASARARRELSLLVSRAPRSAQLYRDDRLDTVPIEEVRPGDLVLVRPGDVVGVDGVVATGLAVLDESALTGESLPVERWAGEPVRSGSVNGGSPFDLRATATADESAYAGIVRLVRLAQASKAPFVRTADRFAVFFLPLTLAVAALAWIVSGDPVRALAVLVVATPCPLILAAPVAIVSGISREARIGVIVKGGGALEALGRASVLLVDKTGTLTAGAPAVAEVAAFGVVVPDEVLRLAASLEQVSPHVMAGSIVAAARRRGLRLALPEDVVETPGAGISGAVEGRRVVVGRGSYAAAGGSGLPRAAEELARRTRDRGASDVFVGVDGVIAGALVLEDPMRTDTTGALTALREAGVRRVVVVTGDHRSVATLAAEAIAADAVVAECTPEQKVEAVLAERPHGVTVMVGDGINDAPALAAADVGVALGGRGASASSEAADVVLTVDRLDRLAAGVRIARRTRRIALQSVIAGMALSTGAMLVAAAGHLPPVAGAVFQELIDVLVIANALRALGGGGDGAPSSPPAGSSTVPGEARAAAAGPPAMGAAADPAGTPLQR